MKHTHIADPDCSSDAEATVVVAYCGASGLILAPDARLRPLDFDFYFPENGDKATCPLCRAEAVRRSKEYRYVSERG